MVVRRRPESRVRRRRACRVGRRPAVYVIVPVTGGSFPLLEIRFYYRGHVSATGHSARGAGDRAGHTHHVSGEISGRGCVEWEPARPHVGRHRHTTFPVKRLVFGETDSRVSREKGVDGRCPPRTYVTDVVSLEPTSRSTSREVPVPHLTRRRGRRSWYGFATAALPTDTRRPDTSP
jgi:hypothetical protein